MRIASSLTRDFSFAVAGVLRVVAFFRGEFISISPKEKVSGHKSRALVSVNERMIFDDAEGVSRGEIKNRGFSVSY